MSLYSLALFLYMKKKQLLKQLKNKSEVRKIMAIQGKQKNIEVDGFEFLIQHPGILKVVQIQDAIRKENGSASTEVLYKELMEHCVFIIDKEMGAPVKLTFEFVEANFEKVSTFTEVMGAATEFLFQ